MKYFLSQRMHNLTDKEIIENTDNYVKAIYKINPMLRWVNSLNFKKPTSPDIKNENIYYLGLDLQKLSECNILIVVDNCNKTNRGCIIEYETAKRYGYIIMHFDSKNNTLTKEPENKEEI
jgi:hypothetical protein